MKIGQVYKIKTDYDSIRVHKAKYLGEYRCFYLFQAKNYKLTVLKNDLLCQPNLIKEV